MHKCLLIYPRFQEVTFWNIPDLGHLPGEHGPVPPGYLVELAARLPRDWELQVVDCNFRPVEELAIQAADLVCLGVSVAQEEHALTLLEHVRMLGKPIVVTGPAACAYPRRYNQANYLLLDEITTTLPQFLADYRRGCQSGIYWSDQKTSQPYHCPRFDLLDLGNYRYWEIPVGTRSMGSVDTAAAHCCYRPVVEVLTECTALYQQGYRGHIFFRLEHARPGDQELNTLLGRLATWCQTHGYPYFFSASIRAPLLADTALLRLMQSLDLRYLYLSVDEPSAALARQVSQAASHGILVWTKVLLGTDNQTDSILSQVRQYAREPGTLLTRPQLLRVTPASALGHKLQREKRLLRGVTDLNFIPHRCRMTLLQETLQLLQELYQPSVYLEQARQTAALLVRGAIRGHWTPGWRYYRHRLRRLRQAQLLPLKFWWHLACLLGQHPRAIGPYLHLLSLYVELQKYRRTTTKRLLRQLKELQTCGVQEYHRRWQAP